MINAFSLAQMQTGGVIGVTQPVCHCYTGKASLPVIFNQWVQFSSYAVLKYHTIQITFFHSDAGPVYQPAIINFPNRYIIYNNSTYKLLEKRALVVLVQKVLLWW